MDTFAIRQFIRTANADDLDRLVDAIQGRRKVLEGEAMQRLVVGSKVRFDGGRRWGMVFGEVTGFTRSKVLVKSTHGQEWRCSAGLLQPSDHASVALKAV